MRILLVVTHPYRAAEYFIGEGAVTLQWSEWCKDLPPPDVLHALPALDVCILLVHGIKLFSDSFWRHVQPQLDLLVLMKQTLSIPGSFALAAPIGTAASIQAFSEHFLHMPLAVKDQALWMDAPL
eukprot:6489528-Amphidinium_carterae.1